MQTLAALSGIAVVNHLRIGVVAVDPDHVHVKDLLDLIADQFIDPVQVEA